MSLVLFNPRWRCVLVRRVDPRGWNIIILNGYGYVRWNSDRSNLRWTDEWMPPCPATLDPPLQSRGKKRRVYLLLALRLASLPSLASCGPLFGPFHFTGPIKQDVPIKLVVLYHFESISQVGWVWAKTDVLASPTAWVIFTREMDVLASSPSSLYLFINVLNILKWIQNFFWIVWSILKYFKYFKRHLYMYANFLNILEHL